MLRYMMLVDIEGVTGVTTFHQAEKEPFGRDMMMHDINAVLEGILSEPGNEVLIFEEHTDGCNIDLSDLPAGVQVVRGKPLINGAWKGIDSSYDGLIMVGFHARYGVEGALLPHSYGPQNRDIRINGVNVGEIGVEAGMAGDAGVPLVLVTGDSAGCDEASELVPGVMTVSVKEALGSTYARCLNPKDSAAILREAGLKLARGIPDVKAKTYGETVSMEIDLAEGAFADTLRLWHPELFVSAHTIVLNGKSVTEVWQRYLQEERRINSVI